MKALRYVFSALVALIVLAIAVIGIAMAVINPNDYKPQIEAAVEDNTHLDLILAGDIGWSFLPLGLELNDVEATLENERLIALDQLIARVNLWSLLSLSPQVDTFVLSGLDARLKVDAEGNGNWTRILPENKGNAAAQNADAEPAGQTTPETTEDSKPLNFNVETVEILNAQVHYDDQSTGQSITLEDFTLTANQITLGSAFPIDLRFGVETAKPQFALSGRIQAQLQANTALTEFSVSGLDAAFDMSGEPFGGKSVTAELGGSLGANLEEQTATLEAVSVRLANLVLNTDLNVQGFGDQPHLEGQLAVDAFSLKQLLSALGQPAIETEDPEVLNNLAFTTQIGGEPGVVALSGLTLTLDDTTFSGGGQYTLKSGGLVFDLNGDALNADRYLPPASDTPNQPDTTGEESTGTASAAGQSPDAELLPLETLRTLLLDIDFGLGELIVSNLNIQDIKASATAKNGVLQIDEFSGKLYEGGFNATLALDARTNNPKWRIRSDVANVQTLPLLTALAEVDMLAGGANLDMAVDSTGNRISALRDNASGQINFNLAEGQFRNMNLTRFACQGIAMVNQDTLTTTDWGTHTPFNDMRGTLVIDGNTLNNTDLVAALAGMRLEGNGTVDLARTDLDYELGLRIVGEIHRDNACRVTEYVENVVIPVECRGNFSEAPGKLCSFDGSRFRDTLKDIAANAAKAKAREEVDRAKQKAEDKVKEKLQEKLGDEAGDKVRDALKGLFN